MFPVNRLLSLLLILGQMPVTCRAQPQQQQGVLYYNFGGLSGKGLGEIRLAINGKPTELQYQKPLREPFKNYRCNDPGAIWTVDLQATANGLPRFSRATCDGRVDEQVHSSWVSVREYLDLVSKGSAESAAAFVSPVWKSTQEFRQYQRNLSTLDLSGYRDFGGAGLCLAVIEKKQSGQVLLEAGADCLVSMSNKPVRLSFQVIRDTASQRWMIEKITSGGL